MTHEGPIARRGGGARRRHREDAAALTRLLVAIDATNPSLVAGGAGEREIALVIAEWLSARGFDVRLVGADPERPSVLARRPGAGGGATLLLAGHLDTVGGAGTAADASERSDAGVSVAAVPDAATDRIVGRGAYDMAGGLAAAMIAAAAAPADLPGDLVLAFAADEEFGSLGMEELLAAIDADVAASDDLRPDAAVVLEPTDLEVTLAHRGFAWYRVEYEGVAAHGSQPGLGVDAIDRALDGLIALRALGDRLGAAPGHPLLGTGSVRVAMVEGGSDAATVADRCVLTVERRTLPGEPDPGAELERVLAASGPARIVPLVARPAMEADDESAIARAVLRAVERETGRSAVRRGDPWWTDAGLIAEAGIPVVLVGAAGAGAHADEEWVSIDSLGVLVDVLVGSSTPSAATMVSRTEGAAVTRALFIIDVQNDFTEGGALGVEGGAAVAEGITEYLGEHREDYSLVVASRDWHSGENDNGGHFAVDAEPDFATTWPPHCVEGTPGAEYHPALDVSKVDVHIRKGQGVPAYSIYEGTDDEGASISEVLAARGITDVDIVGIATDHCVRASALDALEHGQHVRVLTDLIAGVAPETSEAALAELGHAGAVITESRAVDEAGA